MAQPHRATLRVGMVGYAFMGKAHSHAWRSANRFFDLPREVDMAVICGRDADSVETARQTLGWREAETDWRRVVARDDIDLVDICTPGDTHNEIAIAALEAGKHVLCEKPLANSVDEAVAMTAAAEAARARGVRSMVGFTYRRVPAIGLARTLVEQGRIGTIRHVRAQYLQDWITDPEAPLSWRLQKEKAGSGALGDIGAHIIDLTQYITGERITGVAAMLETFVKERPLPQSSSGLSGVGGSDRGEVTVDDAAVFLARFTGGALATFEATRFAAGRKNAIRIEINGSDGQPGVRLRGHERVAVPRPHRGRGDRRASAGFSSPSRCIPTCPPGGRPGTCSATSTGSPTKSSTSSKQSQTASTLRRPSPTGCSPAGDDGGRGQRCQGLGMDGSRDLSRISAEHTFARREEHRS